MLTKPKGVSVTGGNKIPIPKIISLGPCWCVGLVPFLLCVKGARATLLILSCRCETGDSIQGDNRRYSEVVRKAQLIDPALNACSYYY